MKTFIVSVLRTSYAWRDIEINAASEAEARATVLDICGDYEYSEKDADYSIEQVADKGEPCFYCGGNCPQDEDHACDGYLGDLENIYGETA